MKQLNLRSFWIFSPVSQFPNDLSDKKGISVTEALSPQSSAIHSIYQSTSCLSLNRVPEWGAGACSSCLLARGWAAPGHVAGSPQGQHTIKHMRSIWSQLLSPIPYLWTGRRIPGENPCRPGENIQTPDRKASAPFRDSTQGGDSANHSTTMPPKQNPGIILNTLCVKDSSD